MDSKKIGTFIYKLRIQNNLTQKELADKLLVTSQAISKWENGRGIPDIEMLQKLSEIFNVDISELLAGDIKEKKYGMHYKKIIITCITALVILCSIIILVNNSSDSDFKISKLASDNASFHIKGIIAYSNNKKSIYISNVDYSKEENKKEFKDLECVLYEIDGDVERKISTCSSQTDIDTTFTLSELLKDIELNVDNYTCSCGVPVCNKLYLKINATNKDEEIVTYNVPLELESSCDAKD